MIRDWVFGIWYIRDIGTAGYIRDRLFAIKRSRIYPGGIWDSDIGDRDQGRIFGISGYRDRGIYSGSGILDWDAGI